MLTELNGKAGSLCQPAREGTLRCPLLVRPTSEDVITGHLFGSLQAINPRWWLLDFLNQALGEQRFRSQVFRKLRIELWQKQPPFPRSLVGWDEGQTEVDCVIFYENPPTTIFIEMKYGSKLSSTTVNNNGHAGFPSDQLIRNARVGLYQCGWYDEERLFEMPPRDFALILLTPTLGNALIPEYRDPEKLRAAIPHSEKLSQLPTAPFVGELSYRCVVDLLNSRKRFMAKSERILVSQLDDYLRLKLSQLKGSNGHGHG
jgi:hypothetical protein